MDKGIVMLGADEEAMVAARAYELGERVRAFADHFDFGGSFGGKGDCLKELCFRGGVESLGRFAGPPVRPDALIVLHRAARGIAVDGLREG